MVISGVPGLSGKDASHCRDGGKPPAAAMSTSVSNHPHRSYFSLRVFSLAQLVRA